MTATYEFDATFQQKVVAMLLRDEVFVARSEGIIHPEYFDSEAHSWLADLSTRHFNTHRQIPSGVVVTNEIRKGKSAGMLKPEFVNDLKEVLKYVYAKPDLSNRDYTVEAVSKFARERAIEDGLLKSADIIEKGGDFEDIRKIMGEALDVGSNDGDEALDAAEGIAERADLRAAKLSTTTLGNGITTGWKDLDGAMYHKGWGRKELACIMGGAKSGKSIALQYFAVKAAEAGYNVLFVSCENSAEITLDRMDANISETRMDELATNPTKVKAKVTDFFKKSGILKVHAFPNGVAKCSDLRRLIRKYQSQSVLFDFLVVDYADEMAPEFRESEERFNLRQIYQGLRRICVEENMAGLTATQTNRAGGRSNTATKHDVAEDINKTRLVDLLISINADPEEKANGELRLWFAASRNSEDEYGFHCKSNRSTMRFITKILSRTS
ncbi:MAG: AAA family ATPase [Hyphomonas sp.]|nr:AAA family ATPase [Hyphomonas sp.]